MNSRLALVSLIASLSALGAVPAVADNACKALSQPSCDGSTQCSWVQGYTRKDGREVAAYCRAKPAAKSSADGGAKAMPAG